MTNKKVRHVMGISGGKDSAALAIYMYKKYPELDIEYYFSDTGKELEETYTLIKNLENYLGKKITRIESAKDSHEDPFDHFLKLYGGFLPASNARWCTKKLKLEPFEKFVGDDPVVSYVGIRGDEDREGYISKKSNIQSIFPFRQNIWSEDVVKKVLHNDNLSNLVKFYKELNRERLIEIAQQKVNPQFTIKDKLNSLLNGDVKAFNQCVYSFLQQTEYPLSLEDQFPLLDNDDVLVREDIFKTLRESGVGVPEYYEKVDYEVNGKTGQYARSRSGCFFCFFQQKIEWVWLYEKHPEKFEKAMEYEKDGYTWMQDERLEDLIKPERITQIKQDHLKRMERAGSKKSPYLLDNLAEAEGLGCAACFI